MFINLLLMFGILLLDQGTKYLVYIYRLLLPLEITSFFNIIFTYNRGISFGMLHDSPKIMQYGLIAVNSLLTLFLIKLWKQTGDKIAQYGFSLIISGAIGNLLDRFIYGAVVDFLDFHWHEYTWPAFNVADSCIVIGVGILLWRQYKGEICASS